MRTEIRAEVCAIEPLDALEQQHIADTLEWIDSGAELCRLVKPATPPKHLISYFAVVDGAHVLLVDHKNAQRWLPTGGHVEPGEHPRQTVARELREELGFELTHAVTAPLMLTSTVTVGLTAGHTDVSLWYVVRGDRDARIAYDPDEFNGARWFHFSEVAHLNCDPHLDRFIAKLARRQSPS